MFASLSLPAHLVILMLGTFAEADFKPYISTGAEIRTECKTCPRSLCANQLYYDYEESLNVTCWTRGTKIMGDRLWLQSTAGCYVTQYDLYEYSGEFTDDLKYCGADSEEQDLTTEDATLKYKTECRICPYQTCETIAYLPENTDVELTCWTSEGAVIIDDPYWMKTTNNCYVAQKNLYSKPDITYLVPCGPVPSLEFANHNNENGTSDVNKRNEDDKRGDISAMYLVNVTIGEEYAPCRTCAKASCKPKKVYEFDQEVYIQCITEYSNATYSEWWAETTDFCYVKDTDFWQAIYGDFRGMPLCEFFGNGGAQPSGDDDLKRP